MDQYEFRMKHLEDERLKAVLEKTANHFGWKRKPKQAGVGYGIACGFEKGGYVATCAEVLGTGETVKIIRLTEAFECGAVINPLHLENQVLGGHRARGGRRVVRSSGLCRWEIAQCGSF
jgi:isoquinoline 1-oxidoreductase